MSSKTRIRLVQKQSERKFSIENASATQCLEENAAVEKGRDVLSIATSTRHIEHVPFD